RLAPEIDKAGSKSIAVADFLTIDGKATDLGWYLANKLSDGIVLKSPATLVVDRTRLQQLGLASGSNLTADALKQIGTASGADALVSGKIEIIPEKYLLTINLVKIADGSTITSFTHSLPHSRILDLLSPSGANAATITAARAGVSGVGVPACAYCPAPAYSGRARITQVQTVELLVTISAAGTAEKISVIHSPGSILSERAVETVSDWKFRPAPGKDGAPVPVAVPIDVTFKASRT
ncbi:MAG: energy transducer TonB, partial [Acidobacteria bacterium]|nr:energy transducer TonB [Acidobacteriota bacterium]